MLLGIATLVVAILGAYLGAQRAQSRRVRKGLQILALVLGCALAANLLNLVLENQPRAFETSTPGPPSGSAMAVREVPFPVTAPGELHRATWTGGEMPFRIVSPTGEVLVEGRGGAAQFTPQAEGNWTLRLEVPAGVDTMRIRVVEVR